MLSRLPTRVGLVAASLAVIAAGLTAGSASADNPTAADLQSRLLENRQRLNALYADAAMANERVNGATYELEVAEGALAKHRSTLEDAKQQYDGQREVVEALTVEQQLTGSTSQAMLRLLDGGSSTQILEEASSLKAVDEAMTAELDRLEAGRTVLDAASDAVEKVVRKQRAALAERKRARAQIDAAIAQAEALATSMAADREVVVRELALAQGKSVEQVDRELTELEEQIDASGPSAPLPPTAPPTPRPTTPAPSTAAPTTPAPAPTKSTPTPTPPAPQPDPTPEPPPASSSKVETAIAYAQAQLGEPYAWGGAGPSKWDCSGLVMRAYEAAGIKLAHHAVAQYKATKAVSVGSIKRGDLLYWSNGSVDSIYHVAIYLGSGKMIHAPRPGRNVEIVSVSYWIKPDKASRPG